MTVLSLQRRVARLRWVARPRWVARLRWVDRLRRLTALPRHLDPARRPARTERHVYADPFFADPAAVEDDSRRMTRPAG
jgi:hypothetical protein